MTWQWSRDDVRALRRLVDVAANMTAMTVSERAVDPGDFDEERAVVKTGADLLARVERSERVAFCSDCGSELTWPLGQENPWSCGRCNEENES